MIMHHIGTKSIETVRLLLRRFESDDAEDMYRNWAGDPEVCKYLSWGPHKDVEVSKKRIRDYLINYEFKDYYVWAIVLKSINQPIGSISVELSDESSRTCEVGYCLGKSYWNRGIMTEALLAVMHYLFFDIEYQRIMAKHDVLNVASGKVMQKAGMQFSRLEPRVGTRKDGTIYDCAVYVKHFTDE
ncbi:GNAT family N-acetyltransferase [Lachnospiraceae bacterium MD1]|uniref:GNAT family N-acetyltransferase n=1 Tax=Variimorphobacter saccharofermentans TaxID=2755051 RepID=A0A839JYS8_9FIRM|nr:GNAT family N-acetyltransferase [Variimorphobacter saccharofermentans]MBB2182367.1 GNAT family N-acetyltransferase [Variimorphobacter saccharofermentans]